MILYMICTKCNLDKDTSCFSSRGSGKLHRQCKICKRIAIKIAYEKKKPEYIQRAKESNKKIRRKISNLIIKAKDKPCVDCGRELPHYCMDLDHLPGSIKIDNVSCLVKKCSVKIIETEIAKCEVVCAVCHRIRTWERQQQLKKIEKF